MDSPPLAPSPPAGAPARAGRLASAARGAVRAAWWTAALGAFGALALWTAVFAGRGADLSDMAVVGLLLLVPAAAAAVLAWTLGGLVALPGDLRAAARSVVVPPSGERGAGLFRTVWALRGVVVGSTEAWARTAGLARLASLPFVLGLLALVALNPVLAVVGAVALLWRAA